MELAAAVRLIEKGVMSTDHPQAWADLGAGDGLFTRAVASLLKAGSVIYAIDKILPPEITADKNISIIPLQKNFLSDDLGVSAFDGVIMANSLHYVEDQPPFIQKLKNLIKPDGAMIIVEYDRLTANRWVPFPVSFDQLRNMAVKLGLSARKLQTHPSVYHNTEMYAALLSHT